MSQLQKEYYKLIDRCNTAESEAIFNQRTAELDGFRQCLDVLGIGWSGIEDDLRTMRLHGDVPMTCGVLRTKYL